jgi:hypothetical protein
MAEQNLWQRLVAAVNREYERRIRAASLVAEYGAHHAHGAEEPDDDAEVAVIANVPRGTRLGRRPAPEQTVDH